MNIEVEKEDILKMSDTIFPIDGFTVFELSSEDDAFWLKEILIRNIIRCFGSYKIVSVEDYKLDSNGFEVVSLIIKTDLTWDFVCQLSGI